jgi:hypothetical protein
VTTLEPLPYSPDLTVVDFDLFSRLKSVLKERPFCDATDVIKNAMEKLKRLSLNSFQECFQHLYSHWRNCVVPQGNYFAGNVA